METVELPIELWGEIAIHLPPTDLPSLLSTCRSISQISSSQWFWKQRVSYLKYNNSFFYLPDPEATLRQLGYLASEEELTEYLPSKTYEVVSAKLLQRIQSIERWGQEIGYLRVLYNLGKITYACLYHAFRGGAEIPESPSLSLGWYISLGSDGSIASLERWLEQKESISVSEKRSFLGLFSSERANEVHSHHEPRIYFQDQTSCTLYEGPFWGDSGSPFPQLQCDLLSSNMKENMNISYRGVNDYEIVFNSALASGRTDIVDRILLHLDHKYSPAPLSVTLIPASLTPVPSPSGISLPRISSSRISPSRISSSTDNFTRPQSLPPSAPRKRRPVALNKKPLPPIFLGRYCSALCINRMVRDDDPRMLIRMIAFISNGFRHRYCKLISVTPIDHQYSCLLDTFKKGRLRNALQEDVRLDSVREGLQSLYTYMGPRGHIMVSTSLALILSIMSSLIKTSCDYGRSIPSLRSLLPLILSEDLKNQNVTSALSYYPQVKQMFSSNTSDLMQIDT